jgi:hypothetical protein
MVPRGDLQFIVTQRNPGVLDEIQGCERRDTWFRNSKVGESGDGPDLTDANPFLKDLLRHTLRKPTRAEKGSCFAARS